MPRDQGAKPKPVPFVANLNAPDLFASGAFGAFVDKGNVHITLVARRCDYSSDPNILTDVVIGRLVMPLSATEQMVQFLENCLNTIKQQDPPDTDLSRILQ
jgi:hypothetical protein